MRKEAESRVTYDYRAKKVVAVVAANVEPGIALNVIGHLGIALGAHADAGLMGRAQLTDGSGVHHVGISRYPVIVTRVKQGRLRRLVEEARQQEGLVLVDYPEQMLTTAHDDDLAKSLAGSIEPALVYLGAILFGDAGVLTELTGKFTLWK